MMKIKKYSVELDCSYIQPMRFIEELKESKKARILIKANRKTNAITNHYPTYFIGYCNNTTIYFEESEDILLSNCGKIILIAENEKNIEETKKTLEQLAKIELKEK